MRPLPDDATVVGRGGMRELASRSQRTSNDRDDRTHQTGVRVNRLPVLGPLRLSPVTAISLAGRTTIRQLLALYGLAEVLVTNDNHTIWAGLACSPCVNAFNDRQSPCTNNLCMQHITVDQVFEQVCRIYEARRARAQ